jgi:hypothetical protein
MFMVVLAVRFVWFSMGAVGLLISEIPHFVRDDD